MHTNSTVRKPSSEQVEQTAAISINCMGPADKRIIWEKVFFFWKIYCWHN